MALHAWHRPVKPSASGEFLGPSALLDAHWTAWFGAVAYAFFTPASAPHSSSESGAGGGIKRDGSPKTKRTLIVWMMMMIMMVVKAGLWLSSLSSTGMCET